MGTSPYACEVTASFWFATRTSRTEYRVLSPSINRNSRRLLIFERSGILVAGAAHGWQFSLPSWPVSKRATPLTPHAMTTTPSGRVCRVRFQRTEGSTVYTVRGTRSVSTDDVSIFYPPVPAFYSYMDSPHRFNPVDCGPVAFAKGTSGCRSLWLWPAHSFPPSKRRGTLRWPPAFHNSLELALTHVNSTKHTSLSLGT